MSTQKTPTVRKPKTTTEEPKDKVLDKALKDFNASWDYRQGGLHDRWMDNYMMYHGQRVRRGYEGITDTFVPMSFSTVETLRSALFGSKPKFNFLPPSSKPDQKTDILNAWIDYCWERDQWSIKVSNTGLNMLSLGNGFDFYSWDRDHPVMYNVGPRDFIIDPTYFGYGEPRYVGRRFLDTVENLETFEVIDVEDPQNEANPKTGEIETTYPLKKKYKHLDTLTTNTQIANTTTATGDQTTDKQEKDMFFGSTLGEDAPDQVEVIELWYEDRVVSIANRKVVIEDIENPHKAKAKLNGVEFPKGILPFAWARDFIDPNLFYAKGEIDFILDQNELLNDMTNQNIDAVTYVLNPMFTLDPDYVDQIEEVESLPGAVYPFRKDALNRVDMGNVPVAAFNERINVKNEIRETTASNEIVKGGKADSGDPTATEVNAQIAGASSRLKLKITQIENEYFHRMARIVLELTRLYVTEKTLVRVVGKDGAKWEEFDPSEYAEGEYEPRVQLDIEIENQKVEAATNAKEMYAAFAGDPDINQQELKKIVLAKGFQLDPDEVEILTQVQPPMLGGSGMPPSGDPNDLSDIPPEVALQLPPDADEEDIALIRQALASEASQGQPPMPQGMPV